jgi:hypothetical protein
MNFSPDGKQLVLATNSVQLLDTEPESQRSKERRLDREARKRAQPLVASVVQKTSDLLQAREQVHADTALREMPPTVLTREFLGACGTRVARMHISTSDSPRSSCRTFQTDPGSSWWWLTVSGAGRKA